MNTTWQPTANLKVLQRRADTMYTIRQFFKERDVMEVTTPLLSHHTVTDPHLESFMTEYQAADNTSQTMYLQTSPEFAMKRLLAAGSGPIYQMTPAFRNQGEQGRWHNPEFTLLEWYRPQFTLTQLMDETEALLQLIIKCPSAQRLSYAELFQHCLNLDPHKATLQQIQQALRKLSSEVELSGAFNKRDTALQLITDHLVQHCVDTTRPLFLYHFPASQAALARIHPSLLVAERCELYFNGLELANGFHELQDSVEQKKRFLEDLAIRKKRNLSIVPLDSNLIAALSSGLPDSCGIALGIDRLIALATQNTRLDAVLTFPITRA